MENVVTMEEPMDDSEHFVDAPQIDGVPEDEDEAEADFQRILQPMAHEQLKAVGLREDEQTFTMPGVEEHNRGGEGEFREDGFDDDDRLQRYGSSWLQEREERRKLVESDPQHQFFVLVAGHGMDPVEDLYDVSLSSEKTSPRKRSNREIRAEGIRRQQEVRLKLLLDFERTQLRDLQKDTLELDQQRLNLRREQEDAAETGLTLDASRKGLETLMETIQTMGDGKSMMSRKQAIATSIDIIKRSEIMKKLFPEQVESIERESLRKLLLEPNNENVGVWFDELQQEDADGEITAAAIPLEDAQGVRSGLEGVIRQLQEEAVDRVASIRDRLEVVKLEQQEITRGEINLSERIAEDTEEIRAQASEKLEALGGESSGGGYQPSLEWTQKPMNRGKVTLVPRAQTALVNAKRKLMMKLRKSSGRVIQINVDTLIRRQDTRSPFAAMVYVGLKKAEYNAGNRELDRRQLQTLLRMEKNALYELSKILRRSTVSRRMDRALHSLMRYEPY